MLIIWGWSLCLAIVFGCVWLFHLFVVVVAWFYNGGFGSNSLVFVWLRLLCGYEFMVVGDFGWSQEVMIEASFDCGWAMVAFEEKEEKILNGFLIFKGFFNTCSITCIVGQVIYYLHSTNQCNGNKGLIWAFPIAQGILISN